MAVAILSYNVYTLKILYLQYCCGCKSLVHITVCIYITNLVCYAYFHWLFNPECQHIFQKQTGYICTFSVSLIWAPKNNNNVVDPNCVIPTLCLWSRFCVSERGNWMIPTILLWYRLWILERRKLCHTYRMSMI
jgi:hypothetical protein